MNFRSLALGAWTLVAGLLAAPASAQDVTIGEPGWFDTQGAPDQAPVTKRKPNIEYPEVLLTSDETSYVLLARYLDAAGNGLMMQAHSTHPWFKAAAENAVGAWPMQPARLKGKPVPSWFWIPIIFNPASASLKRSDAKPRLLAVTPVIIPEALRLKLRDQVVAWGTVSLDAAGVPQKVALEPPANDKLLPFVETALKQWRFDPARKGGEPVAADFRVAFHFFSAMAPMPADAVPPRVVRQGPPEYPLDLRRAGVTGRVDVGFIVDTQGNVVNAITLHSTSPAFNEAAVNAVLGWKFKPATVDGRPVDMAMRVPIMFSFNEGGGTDQVTVRSQSRRAQEALPEKYRYDVAPRPRGIVDPVYPYALLQAGTTGNAAVVLQINPEGRVTAVEVIAASQPEFGLALAAAAELYAFDPALKDGKPTMTVLKTKQDFYPDELLSNDDRSLLRREKKHPDSIVSAGKLDEPLRQLLNEPPAFPCMLTGRVARGTATIEFLIDEQGRARLPRIVTASDPAFGYAAAQAVSRWTYSPPKAGGKAAVARLQVPFAFDTKPPVMGTAVGEPPGDHDAN